MRNALQSIFRTFSTSHLTPEDIEFCERFRIDPTPLKGLKGAELNKAICRRALTSEELPLNWWHDEGLSVDIHAVSCARFSILEHLEPSIYGPKIQEGARGFVLAARLLSEHTAPIGDELRLLTHTTDILDYTRLKERVESA